jgi:hypothetical protein
VHGYANAYANGYGNSYRDSNANTYTDADPMHWEMFTHAEANPIAIYAYTNSYRDAKSYSDAHTDPTPNPIAIYAYTDCYWNAKSYPHAHTNTTASFQSRASTLGPHSKTISSKRAKPMLGCSTLISGAWSKVDRLAAARRCQIAHRRRKCPAATPRIDKLGGQVASL